MSSGGASTGNTRSGGASPESHLEQNITYTLKEFLYEYEKRVKEFAENSETRTKEFIENHEKRAHESIEYRMANLLFIF